MGVNRTFSAGVALYPLHGRDEASLLAAADAALYAAKAAGRNQVRPAAERALDALSLPAPIG